MKIVQLLLLTYMSVGLLKGLKDVFIGRDRIVAQSPSLLEGVAIVLTTIMLNLIAWPKLKLKQPRRAR